MDGEVYKHGLALQDISGQSRRTETELGEVLEYHIFDCFFPDKLDMKSSDRQRILDIIFNDYDGEYCKRVENIVPSSLDEVLELKDVFMQNGYEGIIVPEIMEYTSIHTTMQEQMILSNSKARY